MSKYTKGSWSKRILEAENLSKTRLITAKVGEIKIDICKLLFTSVLTLDEREANATLISAAPKMYEALQKIRGMNVKERIDLPMLVSTIKATASLAIMGVE